MVVSQSSDRILLVEGPDDKHVVRHLRNRNQTMPTFCIKEKNGIDELLNSVRGEIRSPERRAVGILVDANSVLNNRWQAVSDRLRSVDIEPPSTPESTGTIIPGIDEGRNRRPRVGIWLMPDNESPGELEDFVARMIPPDDPVWPLSEDYINAIPTEARKFAEGKILRAKVHAWLAARREPRPMGAAIGAGDLNVNGPLSTSFADWLRKLFQ